MPGNPLDTYGQMDMGPRRTIRGECRARQPYCDDWKTKIGCMGIEELHAMCIFGILR